MSPRLLYALIWIWTLNCWSLPGDVAPEAGHADRCQSGLSVMDWGLCWPSQPGASDFRQKTCLGGRNAQVAKLLSLAYVLCLGPSVFTFEAVPETKRPSLSSRDMSMAFSFLFFILSHQEQRPILDLSSQLLTTVANSWPFTSTTDWAKTSHAGRQLSLCLPHFLGADTLAAFVPESLQECLCRQQSWMTEVASPPKQRAGLLNCPG